MAIDFPNSPAVDDVFTVGSNSWVWNGTTWNVVRVTTGEPGPGVATGGTAGQVLTKIDSTDYNTQWSTINLSSKQDVVFGVSSTEIGYLDGVTSAIQTQLNAKSPLTGSSSITSLGAVTTGTWSATAISPTKGGTGLTTISANQAVYGNGTNTITSGTLPIAAGGTGATTAMTAATALLPSQTSNSGKYLTNDGSGTLSWSTVPALIGTSIINQSSYTLALSDSGKFITNQFIGGYIYVPLNSSVAFPIGTQIIIMQGINTGQQSIAPSTVGVTLLYTPGLRLRTQNSVATLLKIDTNTWSVFGDLVV